MSVFLVVGTRPQIIKSIPVIKTALKENVDLKIVHTGQHYDHALSQVFFDELASPEPFVNLNVGSGSHIQQVADIMQRLEKYLLSEKPSVVLIPGDTNSALAGALACAKLGIPVAHIESGARSYDMKMAEEINRRLIDHCSKILFTPTAKCTANLKNESVTGDIYEVGDTMYDVFVDSQIKVSNCDMVKKLGLASGAYAVLTTHRAENVDDPIKINRMFSALKTVDIPIIFPIHPRTKDRLGKDGISLSGTNIRTIDPVTYTEMLTLLKNAKIVITDSGGLQKEAFWSNTPCITIRDRTEWTETVDLGVNFVTDVDPVSIQCAFHHINDNYNDIKQSFRQNPYGDGTASQKIIGKLKELNLAL